MGETLKRHTAAWWIGSQATEAAAWRRKASPAAQLRMTKHAAAEAHQAKFFVVERQTFENPPTEAPVAPFG